MRVVFQNLIENALKYAKPGERPVVRLSSERLNAGWLFRCRDEGKGTELNTRRTMLSTHFGDLMPGPRAWAWGLSCAADCRGPWRPICGVCAVRHHGRLDPAGVSRSDGKSQGQNTLQSERLEWVAQPIDTMTVSDSVQKVHEALAFGFRQVEPIGFPTKGSDDFGQPFVEERMGLDAVAKIHDLPQRREPAIVHVRRGEADIPQADRFEPSVIGGLPGEVADAAISGRCVIHIQAIDGRADGAKKLRLEWH